MNIITYFINFLPILIGILAFYFIKSIKLSKNKIRIYTKCGVAGNQTQNSDIHFGIDKINKFDNIIKDELITAGLLKKGVKINSSMAFSILGFIERSNISCLNIYSKKHSKNKISLFYNKDGDILEVFLQFGGISGMLIAYGLASSLEFRNLMESS